MVPQLWEGQGHLTLTLLAALRFCIHKRKHFGLVANSVKEIAEYIFKRY